MCQIVIEYNLHDSGTWTHILDYLSTTKLRVCTAVLLLMETEHLGRVTELHGSVRGGMVGEQSPGMSRQNPASHPVW